MSEYYAVQRSGDSLVHYGVKGMRWGVKKAVVSGNNKALEKQYSKATKKLKKLKAKADTNEQTKVAMKEKKRALLSAADTALAGAVSIGTVPKDRIATVTSYISGPYGVAGAPSRSSVRRSTIDLGKSSPVPHYIAGAATAQGLARTAYHTGKAIMAKKRANPNSKAHAKAVAKANEWQNEMNKVFSGTKYGKKSKKRR